MLPILAALAAAVSTVAAPAQPPRAEAAPAPRFDGLFTKWGDASRESLEAERRAALSPAPEPSAPESAVGAYSPGSPALGQRVGEVVALGDCAEGERMARAAGDFALVAAVRDYCQPRPAAGR